MMGFTADGQVDPRVLAARDQELGLSTATKKRQRTDLPDPIVDPNADAWRSGKALQLELRVQGPPDTVAIPMH
jgi:hypothetical protein